MQFGISACCLVVFNHLRKPVRIVPVLVIEEIPFLVSCIVEKIGYIAIPRDRVSAPDVSDQIVVDASVARKMRVNVLLRNRYFCVRDAGMVKNIGDNIQEYVRYL